MGSRAASRFDAPWTSRRRIGPRRARHAWTTPSATRFPTATAKSSGRSSATCSRDPRRRGERSRMVPDDVRVRGEGVPRVGEARARHERGAQAQVFVRVRGAGRPPRGPPAGRVASGAHRGTRNARTRRAEATWRCFCGRAWKGVRGTSGRARTRRREGTWRCFGGRTWTPSPVGRGDVHVRSLGGVPGDASVARVGTGARGIRRTCQFAAGGGLEVLRWARQNGCPWDEFVSGAAAKRGRLEVLRWAHENGCPWDEMTCANAAEGGHLETLRAPRGCPWDCEASIYAARNGHLRVLQWARANGCPWEAATCAHAAEGGHVEVLRWARESVPLEPRAFCAARRGQRMLLQWAHGNPRARSAGGRGRAHTRCRPYLIEHGCPRGP